jgi:hypothetical protein
VSFVTIYTCVWTAFFRFFFFLVESICLLCDSFLRSDSQVTALEPTKTSFFAALDIATKITRGCVEILNDVKLCEKNRKVGGSEAALLQMLDIKPFTYGLKIVTCWDGSIFAPAFLDFTESDLFRYVRR